MSTNKNMFKGFDKISDMRNMLNGSLIDMLIPEIKSKKNENVIKMLDMVKDKPDMCLNILIVAIFHKNLKIVELIIEKYFTPEIEEPYINTHFLYNAILPENSKNKLTDSKNNYSEEICPYAVMAGIGGDIEIFKLLYKKNLINNYNINNSGIIGLTKKYKNTFFSNIVGACAYYGNEKLLEFILDNYRSELDININTTEKKTKNSKIHFSKEFSEFPPVFLGVGGFISDKKTVEILKIFEEFKANFESKDFNENNIIHIATKEKKILSLKFLVESLGLKNIINEENINNETPYTIAKQSKNKEIIDFLDSYIKQDENIIKKNLEELINEDNKKKNKIKNKKQKNKNNKDNFNFFNSSEYEETLGSIQEKKEKTNEENNDGIKEENNIDSIEGEEEEKEKEENNDKNNEYNETKKKKFSNKNNNYYGKNNSKNKNDIYNTYNTYNIYNNYTSDNQYYKYNSKSYYNNMKYNDKYNDNNNKNYNYQYSNDYKNKYNKGKFHNNDYYNNDYNYNENRKSQKGKYNNKNWNIDNNYNNNYYKEKSYAIEIKDDNNDKNINNSIEKNNLVEHEEIKKEKEKDDTIENSNNNIKNNDKENIIEDDNNNKNDKEKEEEEEEEYSYSEEEFLTQSEKKEEKTIKKSEYDNLYKKYFDAERKVNNLEKEKMELNKCIKKIYLNNNQKYIPNEENNINSLLYLANNELEKKEDIINKLKEQTKMADLTNIKSFQKDRLKEYKNFYNKNLKIINDMLKQFEKL